MDPQVLEKLRVFEDRVDWALIDSAADDKQLQDAIELEIDRFYAFALTLELDVPVQDLWQTVGFMLLLMYKVRMN